MNAQEYNLNIRPGYGYSQTVKVSQDDIGRPLEFHLYDGMDLLSITVGSVIVIHATKPSGLGFTETCTWSGSTASISTTESMTQESGAFPAELVITSGGDVLGTANFTFCVERSPHPDGTTDGTKEELDDLYAEVAQLKDDLSGWGSDTKLALLNAFAHVEWTDEHGQDYYDALEAALYPDEPPATLESISAVYTQSGTVYDTDTLDSLKADLVVTATYDDSSTAVVTAYTLSGTLEAGTSTITVSYGGKTTTFNVTVSSMPTHLYELVESDFKRKTRLDGYAPNYYHTGSTDDNKRISHTDFDLLLQGGKTYRFIAESTKNTARMGLQFFNQNILDAVNSRVDFNNAVEMHDSGWQSLDTTYAVPLENNSSPIKGVRIGFQESSANPIISDDFAILSLVIDEVV